MSQTLSTWVRRRRLAKGLSQTDLGEMVGMSRTWVTSLERGTFRPKIEQCVRLAEIFGAEPAEIVTMAGHPLSSLSVLRSIAPAATAAPTERPPWADEMMGKVLGELRAQRAALNALLSALGAAEDGTLDEATALAIAGIRDARSPDTQEADPPRAGDRVGAPPARHTA